MVRCPAPAARDSIAACSMRADRQQEKPTRPDGHRSRGRRLNSVSPALPQRTGLGRFVPLWTARFGPPCATLCHFVPPWPGMCRQIPDKANVAIPGRRAAGAAAPGQRERAAAEAALLSLKLSPQFSPGSRPASRPGVRSARSGPKSVAGTTVEARDAAGGRLGATRRAALSGLQSSSSLLPDVPASRFAALLLCRPDRAAQTMTLVRNAG